MYHDSLSSNPSEPGSLKTRLVVLVRDRSTDKLLEYREFDDAAEEVGYLEHVAGLGKVSLVLPQEALSLEELWPVRRDPSIKHYIVP